MLSDGLPRSGESVSLTVVSLRAAGFRRIRRRDVRRIASPTKTIVIAAANRCQQINCAGPRLLCPVPSFFQRIPAPGVRCLFLKELHGIANGDSAEFDAVREIGRASCRERG